MRDGLVLRQRFSTRHEKIGPIFTCAPSLNSDLKSGGVPNGDTTTFRCGGFAVADTNLLLVRQCHEARTDLV
jgi:hypothetical protein